MNILHADYRLLKKQILEERDKITDQELFTSSAYADYQSGMAETAAKRYHCGVQVIMDWDESVGADVAYTIRPSMKTLPTPSQQASLPGF